MEGSLGLVIEALVALLLVVTIGYCVQVNRKLEQLRSDQSELRQIIGELNGATAHAEAAIAKLRTNASAAEETLSGYLEEARAASAQLRGDIADAETLLNKLATVARAQARAVAPPPAAPAAPTVPGPQTIPETPMHDLRASRVGLGLLNARLREGGIAGERSAA